MTSSIPRAERRSGFTLVELLIASTLGAVLLAAVLSSFGHFLRGSVSISDYNGIESSSREALTRFSQEVRMTGDIISMSTTSVNLRIGTGSGYDVRYYYDNTAGSSTRGCFVRQGMDPFTGTNTTRVLIRNVRSDFTFRAYNLNQTEITDLTRIGDIKQIQIDLTATNTRTGSMQTTGVVLSSRYVLRNKKASAVM